MGYNDDDAKILREAAKDGLPVTFVETGDQRHSCYRIQCGHNPQCDQYAQTLASIVEACDRHEEWITVWLDAQGAEEPPPYVAEAIRLLRGFGAAMIVTCNSRSSHEPGALLPQNYCALVREANRHTTLWHPLATQAVRAM